MLPTATPGLDADLLAIKPQAAKSQGNASAGPAFSHELKEHMESRETQQESRTEERDGVEDDIAATESDELEGREEELESEGESRRGKDEDKGEERQESVASGEDEEEEGGKILPFTLATLIPSDTQAAAAEEGEALSVTSGAPRATLAERLVVPRQASQAKGPETATLAQAGAADETLLEDGAGATVKTTKATPGFQAVMEGATAKAKVDAEGEIAALRQLTARPGEAPVSGREALNPAIAATSAASATTAAAQSVAATTPSNLIQLPVQAPVQQPGWDRAMGERMVWMARNNVQEAQLQLNPRHLGPIEVRLSLNQDQAQVNFVAASPQAREALESSLPRLREMFAEQGLNLGQADVQSREQRQREGGQGNGGGGRAFGLGEGGLEEAPAAVHHAPLAPGRLDFYA